MLMFLFLIITSVLETTSEGVLGDDNKLSSKISTLNALEGLYIDTYDAVIKNLKG